ncbi:hypothetical protein KO505_11775 [Psychrosphaera sp. F3M07]|uniref:MaoC/PaaZ C-terminal domain-containing protein n=1 Tax=Psychrosphaera sp. F3M07 TaxID=2841560 RepID=UPI001C0994D7|nr:MaoC/PaaZ C-terminal domain-containing protein [Psychrosphaera sp. F3M07]MBU2918627.1 hypothetical protein [Psychrosphaera sp. F3M07]
MSNIQPLFSVPRLIFRAINSKKCKLEEFHPFSITVKNIYASEKQVSSFTKAFGHPDNIKSYAFLAGFRTTIQCIAQAPIPSSLLGLIHLSCEINQFAKHNWFLPYDIQVTVKSCKSSNKGLTYQIVTDFFQQGELTIQNTNVMLDKKPGYKANRRETTEKAEIMQLGDSFCSYAINLKTAWKYALLSGDLNPIHLHPYLAKKLGLKSVLMHGMFNAHQCLSSIYKKTEEDLGNVYIEFNKPCFMPNQVFVMQYDDSNEYGVFSKNKKDRYIKAEIKKEA